jgi:hypothetical protein
VSCPAKAGHPVTPVLAVHAVRLFKGGGYRIARSCRAMTAI